MGNAIENLFGGEKKTGPPITGPAVPIEPEAGRDRKRKMYKEPAQIMDEDLRLGIEGKLGR